MIRFRTLTKNDNDYYELYSKAYSWDKNNTCFFKKETPELLDLFSQHFALYEDNEFIGYGIHNYHKDITPNIKMLLSFLTHPENMTIENTSIIEPHKISLAYIINPKYRNLGYGKILVEYLINKAQEKTDYDLIEVVILKTNLSSISLIEKLDFEFKSFDEEEIVFQKQIKKN